MKSIAAIINFCSNDYPFLRSCIEKVKQSVEEITIVVCDHFFDGTQENIEHLQSTYVEFPDCHFIQFPYESTNLYAHHGSHMWHNLARLLGTYFTSKEIDYLLFLDTDEIVETSRFVSWLKIFPWDRFQALRLGCYWYFREPVYQAMSWEDTPLLVEKNALTGDLLMHPCEREGLFYEIKGEKKRNVLGLDGLPMIHHYSWVRTKEQMLKKVNTWGQNWRRDWTALVEAEFSHPFLGKDFVHGYTFKRVAPYINLDLEQLPAAFPLSKKMSHVRYLSTQEIHQIDLLLRFGIGP
jgi:hypothetical protein